MVLLNLEKLWFNIQKILQCKSILILNSKTKLYKLLTIFKSKPMKMEFKNYNQFKNHSHEILTFCKFTWEIRTEYFKKQLLLLSSFMLVIFNYQKMEGNLLLQMKMALSFWFTNYFRQLIFDIIELMLLIKYCSKMYFKEASLWQRLVT